jgi:valyl-tRNA synthetase
MGTTVLTPLFRVPVPVVAHELADPEKGTGIAMVCTFGDLNRRHVVARARLAPARRGR